MRDAPGSFFFSSEQSDTSQDLSVSGGKSFGGVGGGVRLWGQSAKALNDEAASCGDYRSVVRLDSGDRWKECS